MFYQDNQLDPEQESLSLSNKLVQFLEVIFGIFGSVVSMKPFAVGSMNEPLKHARMSKCNFYLTHQIQLLRFLHGSLFRMRFY